MREKWYEVTNVSEVASPALLIYPDRVRENIRRMVAIAGGVERLRPHMKTHKLPEVIRMQVEQGIAKFKCATIAEAEMVATAGGEDVLLAYQPVGPNVDRFLELAMRFRNVRLSCVVDNAPTVAELSDAAARSSMRLEVLVDLDVGQHRTGIPPDAHAFDLYRQIASLSALIPGGLHAYDGHIHDADVVDRKAACETAFAPVDLLRRNLERHGLPVPRIVAGGTPTFPMHAKRGGVECSPGTCVFWDAAYGTQLLDLDFLPAAVLLTRVVSKPVSGRLCLDLGHKAVASEMPPPRVVFLNLTDAKAISHSEEHLVVETSDAGAFKIGDCLYGIPWHVCPTVALHSEAVIVENGKTTERWRIVARERRLTV
ncbi:MAG TPA: D-TA family PLP-dependent enzyme [Verrucomicrobiae bacterium]|nr:D-TA family PLP-dependent enzyme [Verrucomicrobiae bacterium]